MSSYDCFVKDDECVLQLKCFDCEMIKYKIGSEVPVEKFGFPKTCTFCDWGGTSKKYICRNIMGEDESMGTFVIIEDGKVKDITEDDSRVLKPVYNKYGNLLEK